MYVPDCSGAGSTGSSVLPDVGAGNPTQALTGRVQAISQAPAPSILLAEKKGVSSAGKRQLLKASLGCRRSRKPAWATKSSYPSPHTHQKRRAQPSEVGVSQTEATDRAFWISALQPGSLWKAIDGGVSRVWDPGPPDWGRAVSSLRSIRLPAGLQPKEALPHLSLSRLFLTSSQACGPTSGQLELDAVWVSRLQFRLFLSLIPKFLCSQPIIYLLIAHCIIYLSIIYKLFITINYVLFIWGSGPPASCMLGKCSTTK